MSWATVVYKCRASLWSAKVHDPTRPKELTSTTANTEVTSSMPEQHKQHPCAPSAVAQLAGRPGISAQPELLEAVPPEAHHRHQLLSLCFLFGTSGRERVGRKCWGALQLDPGLCLTGRRRGVGGRGVWDPKVWVPKVARSDVANDKFRFYDGHFGLGRGVRGGAGGVTLLLAGNTMTPRPGRTPTSR